MNIKRIISILLGIGLIGFGIAFLAWNLLGSDANNVFNRKSKNTLKVGTNSIDEVRLENIDGVKEIDIQVPIAKINIISQDRKDISIHYHGHLSPHIESSLSTKKSKDKLFVKIKNNQEKLHASTNVKLSLDIVLPSSYIDDLNLDADLGYVHIEGLKLDKLHVKADLSDINIKTTKLNKLKAESSLGKISLEDISSIKSEISTNLGAIKAINIGGAIDLKTALGSIDLEYDNFNSDLSAKSDSGSIKVILPKDSHFTIDANTDLGSIKTNFPLNIDEKSNTKLKGKAASGKNNIFLSVDLGSINIESK